MAVSGFPNTQSGLYARAECLSYHFRLKVKEISVKVKAITTSSGVNPMSDIENTTVDRLSICTMYMSRNTMLRQQILLPI